MLRTVPRFNSGLRAVALAAIIGGQSACVRSAPVVAPLRVAGAASRSTIVKAVADEQSGAPPTVVVRDYWRAFKASVVSWADDEEWQGLRGAILRDGTVAYDHILFYNMYAVPNLAAFSRANWYVFSDANASGKQIKIWGARTDVFNCQGKKGCSPYKYFAARIPDNVLRNTRDSLVVKVISYNGYETTIAIRRDLITSYLAVVDSVSAARKAKTAASNH